MEFKFTDPASDFSNGLQVITDYHQDFLARGKHLLTLAKQVKQQGMNEDLANQCMALYWHYSHANHLHHKDEEEALFPLLINQSSLIIGMIERLMLDHEEIEKSWDLLAAMLSQPEQITDFEQFLQLSTAFEKIQRDHLNREDEDFSPQVKKILTEEQLKQAGGIMSDHRHLTTS